MYNRDGRRVVVLRYRPLTNRKGREYEEDSVRTAGSPDAAQRYRLRSRRQRLRYGKGTQAEETGSETETDNSLICDLPKDLNYGGDEVTIIYAKASGREDELVSEGLGNGTVSDAVYERNQMVETQLKIKFALVAEDGLNVASKVDTDIKSSSGKPEFDIVVNGTYMAVTPAIEGKYKNLSALNNIDTGKSYWTQGYNNLTTFTASNRQFLASGPIAISMFRLMFLTIYNRTVMDNNKKEDLYDVVMRGEWTLDYQYNLIKGMYVDSGDNKRTDDDTYGFITGDIISMDPYMVSTGVPLITKDAETRELTFNADAQKELTEVVDAVQKLVHDEGTYLFKTADKDDVGKNYIVEAFAKGKSMMATLMFWNMEHNIEQLATLTYGIAPIPKFSKTQEYRSYVQDQVSSFGISAGVGGDDRSEELAAVLGKETIDTYNTGESRGRETSHSLNYQKLGKELMSQDELAVMDGGKCILQLRGVRPFLSDKYDITKHPNFKYTADADDKNAFDIEAFLSARLKLKPNEVCDVYEVDTKGA